MYRILTIECDVSNDSRVVSSLVARTFDSNSNKIAVLFKTNGSTPYSGYHGFTLTIRYKLANGSVLEDVVGISGDSAETIIRNDVFNIEGTVQVELKVEDGQGFIVTASENAFFNVVATLEGEDVPPNTQFTLGDISDVLVVDPKDGDALIYEAGQWVNKSVQVTGSLVVTSESEPTEVADYWFDIE